MNIILKALSLIPALAFSSILLAQDSGDETEQQRWYKIELFVFANKASDAGNEEHWPEQLDLNYPDKLVELIFDEPASMLGEAGTENNEEITETTEFEEPVQETGPVTYKVLEDEQRLLNRHVKKLLSTGQHRLLFHQAWLQELNDRQQAESILIEGGEQYDNHFELEGYVTISVERYLHIHSNLWLSSFVSTLGMEQAPWSKLPIPPTRLKTQQQQQQLIAEELGLQPINLDSGLFANDDNPFQLLFDKQYTVERTVVMQQHRRMRSQELHYIDHPLMGLLIKIVPYEPDQASEETAESDEPEALLQTPSGQ
jgi:hypothetical protein